MGPERGKDGKTGYQTKRGTWDLNEGKWENVIPNKKRDMGPERGKNLKWDTEQKE